MDKELERHRDKATKRSTQSVCPLVIGDLQTYITSLYVVVWTSCINRHRAQKEVSPCPILFFPAVFSILGIDRELPCPYVKIPTDRHTELSPRTWFRLPCTVTSPWASILVVAKGVRIVINVVIDNPAIDSLVPIKQQITREHTTSLLMGIFHQLVFCNTTSTSSEPTLHSVVYTIRRMNKPPIINDVDSPTEVTTVVVDNGNTTDTISVGARSMHSLKGYRELLIVRSNIPDVRDTPI